MYGDESLMTKSAPRAIPPVLVDQRAVPLLLTTRLVCLEGEGEVGAGRVAFRGSDGITADGFVCDEVPVGLEEHRDAVGEPKDRLGARVDVEIGELEVG